VTAWSGSPTWAPPSASTSPSRSGNEDDVTYNLAVATAEQG
jgi:hypothetical protein